MRFIHWIALGRAVGPCRATLSKLRAYVSLNRVSVQYVFYTGALRVTVQSGPDLLRNSCYSHLRNGGSMTCVTKPLVRRVRRDTIHSLYCFSLLYGCLFFIFCTTSERYGHQHVVVESGMTLTPLAQGD